MTDDEGRTGDGPVGRAPVAAPPWYRRGVVWLGIVVATVAGAWGVSVVAEDRLYRYDVEAGTAEAEAWCEAVEPLGGGVGFWGGMSYDEAMHERRMGGLEAAAAVAPAEIADDLTDVTEAEAERQALALALGERQLAGEVVSGDVLDDLEDEHRVALRRLEELTAQACPRPPA